MIDFTEKSEYGFSDLVRLVAALRGPGGCPWDQVQTHQSIRRNFLEEAYEAWHDRIALLGGIDVDYIIRKPAEDVRRRVAAMLERAKDRGGWAVGTGNSVPEYIPIPQYLAMVETAIGYNPLFTE